MTYKLLGTSTIVPKADLENLQSPANKFGDTRVGGESMGKKAGLRVLCEVSTGVYAEVASVGGKSSDLWRTIDGTTAYTPVNILNAGGGAAWTLTTATYANGVLTATGASAVDATQNVALKAGTYRIAGQVNKHVATVWANLKVTGATDGVVLTKDYTDVVTDATDATTSDATVKFTIAADQTVTFDLSIKDANGDATGAAYINFILESSN